MNLYVGNLSPETTEGDLRTLFSEFGEVVSVKILLDNVTGLPRGFGFVEMADKFHGYDAITHLDMIYFQGNIINVRESKPKGATGGGGNRGGGYNRGGGGFNRDRGGSGGGYNRDRSSGGGFNRDRGSSGGGFNRSSNSSDSNRPYIPRDRDRDFNKL